MLSRVANSIYWMSKYVERAENVARFIHVNLHLMLDYPEEASVRQWEPLVTTSGDNEDFLARYDGMTEENVIRFLTFDAKNPNSILSCLRSARENGRSVRDTISSEMWEELNQFYLMVQKNSRKKNLKDLHGFLSDVKNAGHLFVGLADTVMSHGESWHFARLGRLLERADKTARILDVKYFVILPDGKNISAAYDSIMWGALLKSASAQEMYRKRFHRTYYKDVVDFLVFDPEFPRSLYYCVNTALRSMRFITRDIQEPPAAETALKGLANLLKKTNKDMIIDSGLHQFIDDFQLKLNRISEKIDNAFFAVKNADMKTIPRGKLGELGLTDNKIADGVSQ